MMAVKLESHLSLPTICLCLFISVTVSYIVYQRVFHPLARFPGPFWASLTDLWQVRQFLSLKQPYNLTELHERYGEFVRYGPDKLSITHESAVALIYQKGGRMMPKTEFYDAYGAAHPNVFGTRDEAHHSIRRRHMSYSFSTASVKEMECYLDLHLQALYDKIATHASQGRAFDLKEVLQFYVVDTLGELAFSQSFDVQASNDPSRIPPVVEHSLLAAVTGSWPAMIQTLKKWLPSVPNAQLQKLIQGRRDCAALASRCVEKRLRDLQGTDDKDISNDRRDILTSLIRARDPETGEALTQMDLETEAFGFIIAGTHTTSATTALLFYHLLYAPELLARCREEIDEKLPPLEPGAVAHPAATVEACLPYLRDCVKENFRITPVFTMPLARRIMAAEGLVIGEEHIPRGTSVAICNHAFHHNPNVWGRDHTDYDPSRWERPEIAERSRLLMHFGLGGRQCIGKTIAMANIYKMTSMLLQHFDLELSDAKEAEKVKADVYRSKLPDLVSVGISDLEHPLMVKATMRYPRKA